jgi:hypothetical protein
MTTAYLVELQALPFFFKFPITRTDDPAKEAKYTKSFTIYVGGDEVYERSKADALEAELTPLVGGPIVAQMFRYDTDPARVDSFPFGTRSPSPHLL